MNFRLRTTSQTAERLKTLQGTTNLTPNILARLGIALSANIPEFPHAAAGENNGLEFNRNTLTGDQDYFYKVLIRQHAQRPIDDEEYFPDLFNAHLTRGVELLYQEYQYAGNYDKFITNLVKSVSL